MIWPQSSPALLRVIGTHVLVCFSSKNEHCSQVCPCFFLLIFCSNFVVLLHHLLVYRLILYFIFCCSPLCYSFPLSSSSHSPSFLLAILLLLQAIFCHSPMSFTPSSLSLSNNCIQILVRHCAPKYCIYQNKHKINIHPTQT